MIQLVDMEGPDQIARMRSLIRACHVRICPNTRFRMARPMRNIREDAEKSPQILAY